MTKQVAQSLAIDTQEALRLLDAIEKANLHGELSVLLESTAKLRALLSAKEGEPSAENWEQALDEWRIGKLTYSGISDRAYALRDAEKEKGNG